VVEAQNVESQPPEVRPAQLYPPRPIMVGAKKKMGLRLGVVVKRDNWSVWLELSIIPAATH
jgi:hypothetical protein